MKSIALWSLLFSGIVATCANAVDAGLPAKYAILSLIGDSMTLVTYVQSVGSHIDQNKRDIIPLSDPIFDQVASKAIEDQLRRSRPQSGVAPLSAKSPDLFNEQRKLFDGSRVVLGEDLMASLKKDGVTHLLLVTKHRAEARIAARTGTRGQASNGSGFLEGIGFYIDRVKRTRRADSGESGRGFLAPYVYAKVSLVDLASSMVVGEEVVTASGMVSAARSDNGDPWGAMTAEQKAGALRRLIVREMDRVIPVLVSAQP